MVIRETQMDAFRDSMRDDFEKRMAKRLRSRFEVKLAGTTAAALDKLIRLGVEKAKGYGVVGESDVARFLEYMVEYEPDFDRSSGTAWARRILTAPNVTGTQKMDNLDDFTTFALRP
jgi:hypothetical protein